MANPGSAGAEQPGQFEDLNARVGARLQLLFPRITRGEPVASALIGYLPHEFLIVKAPVVGGLVLKAQNDEPMKARLFTGTRVVEFDTSLRRQFGGAVAYWHLAYPERVRASTLRAAHRAEVDLAARIEVEGQPAPVEAHLVDLSELGARILAPVPLGQTGSTIRVKFALPGAAGADPPEIAATATIKAVRALDGKDSHAHGVQFGEMSERDRLLMQNFVLRWINDGRAKAA